MTTLREFEDALREHGMTSALAVLEMLRDRDRKQRRVAPARRITARKMTPELAQQIVDLHRTTTLTQQEIALKLGVNQGRVNEVTKHGKWLSVDPSSPEAMARDRALTRAKQKPRSRPREQKRTRSNRVQSGPAQLVLGNF